MTSGKLSASEPENVEAVRLHGAFEVPGCALCVAVSCRLVAQAGRVNYLIFCLKAVGFSVSHGKRRTIFFGSTYVHFKKLNNALQYSSSLAYYSIQSAHRMYSPFRGLMLLLLQSGSQNSDKINTLYHFTTEDAIWMHSCIIQPKAYVQATAKFLL